MPRDFREIWTELDTTERDVATVISMVYERISVLDLAHLLNKIGLAPPVGESRFSHARTKEITDRLFELGILLAYDKRGWQIKPLYSEAIMRYASRRPDFNYTLNEIKRELPYKQYWQPKSPEAMMREVRIAFYQQNQAAYNRLQKDAETHYPQQAIMGYFSAALFAEFDPRWVQGLHPEWQLANLRQAFNNCIENLDPLDELLLFLERHPQIEAKEMAAMRDLLCEGYLLRGQWQLVLDWARRETDEWRSAARHLMVASLRDQDEQALELIENVRKGYRKEFSSKFPSELSGHLYLVSLLRSGGVKNAEQIGHFLEKMDLSEHMRFYGPHLALQSLYGFLRKHDELLEKAESSLRELPHNAYSLIFAGLLNSWVQGDSLPASWMKELDEKRDLAQLSGYRWVEMELTTILSLIHPHEQLRETYARRGQDLSKQLKLVSLTDAMPRIESWERALEVLSTLGNGQSEKSKRSKKTARFVWFVDFEAKELEPREQTLSSGGSWSKGRKVSLKRVKTGDVPAMNPQDVAVARAIEEDYGKYYPQGNYRLNFELAVVALVGHPNLYLRSNPQVAVDLVQKRPQLLVEEGDQKLFLSFAQQFKGPGVQVIKETPTRYQVIEVTDDHAFIKRQIGEGLEIPKRARHRLLEVGRRLGKVVEVQSSLSGFVDQLDEIPGDTRIYVHLLPIGETFKVEFFVRPLPEEDQYFKPAVGRQRVMAEKGDQGRVAKRLLEEERMAADAIVGACPTLSRIVYRDYEWQLDEVEDCLNVLLELQPLRAAERIVLEHPRGEKIKLLGSVDFGDLRLGVSGNQSWFDIDGELQLDDRRVLDFRELLSRVSENEKTRFVQLSEGQYIALTDQLRSKLREMEGLLQQTNDGLKLHPLGASMLDDISTQLGGFEADLNWRETLSRIDNAQRSVARVPSTFRAELRPYQLDGFRWLMRLSDWGVGACLADDMGLGKTIQALAVLQARAEAGPALVIAPASVTRNWMREAAKFAPTLNPILLGPGDRAEMIQSVGPYDLLLVSYGLLPFEGDNLSAKNFGTIILDEAQAIKNRGTKRSRVAMQLQGDFRMVTTGTPIENHLGELWNLFQFLNPGLLGTYDRFNDKYANPITKNNDNERRRQLRRLIQPFILRRRKEEVLEELPPKTEVNLTVELSEGERAFYEALRQTALENIEEAEGPNRRFQILAQLSKLRQAACHPKMVDPTIDLPSSKLELVAETINDLRDNGHKVLVFSQFVKHLKLVENWVKEQQIPYQYLDGSTPGKKRDEAVQAFQRGEGDLFLISLKAGGTGLTLTAADYVLHLDPWWNPAVEDQASDRAHRIGQQRPVTVYRLVAEGTIEEKIVKLHREKRDLADSLLAGTETSAKLNADQLLDLIKYG
ncbi:MAG: DEAD/DEAH box helicase [Bacteroidota bacterium]